ncbi:MFS transporter [Sphingomonas sp. C3-2]|uniref:MFS transporter n=1 Tax=Sphingomonas sp. C3-2 TaxID=3062169 RepID=UPI00294B340E|nr:MFS transporter [Sphingomonas sp. C3-2]WOK35445.1 MFS transporter [Sphingomonas sp. C3-2]
MASNAASESNLIGEAASSTPSTSYRWYVVGILSLAYCFSAIDARVLTLLVIPIKQDLQLSDFQISLLQGFAFALLYSVAAIPVGRMVDVANNRSRIIVVGVLFWSVMTVMCGAARSFWQLFAARIGVGVGEATLSPTAYSLISDYFDSKRRALAISFYAIGYPIGGGLALIIGGLLLQLYTAMDGIELPVLGALQPWQMVFVTVGLPGVLVAALLFTIREPVRRDLAKGYEGKTMPISETFRYLARHWRIYGMLIGSVSLIGMLSIGVSLWYPTFLIRTYSMSVADVGIYYGMVMLVCGTVGTIIGGWLSGRLMRKGKADANMRIVLGTTILKSLPLVVGPLMPSAALALAFMAVGTLIGQAAQGVMISAIQDVTPNQLRGQMMALTLLSVNLVGLGLGASFIAAITDFGFGDESALRYSIAIAGAVLLPVIIAMIWAGLPAYRSALVRMGSGGSEA